MNCAVCRLCGQDSRAQSPPRHVQARLGPPRVTTLHAKEGRSGAPAGPQRPATSLKTSPGIWWAARHFGRRTPGLANPAAAFATWEVTRGPLVFAAGRGAKRLLKRRPHIPGAGARDEGEAQLVHRIDSEQRPVFRPGVSSRDHRRGCRQIDAGTMRNGVHFTKPRT
jgi:hypothetical protein